MKLELTICRASEVISLIREREQNGNSFTGVISLEHPCDESVSAEKGRAPRLERELGAAWRGRQLILTCWDIEEPFEDTPAPDKKMVQEALAYVDLWRPSKDGAINLLIHCRSGKARSTALGLIIMRYLSGPGAEQVCLNELLRIRPIAAPNIAIVRHGDELLGCGSALISAVEQNEEVTRRRADANIARARQIESRRPSNFAL